MLDLDLFNVDEVTVGEGGDDDVVRATLSGTPSILIPSGEIRVKVPFTLCIRVGDCLAIRCYHSACMFVDV